HKVPLLKEAHGQGRLKFANEHLNDSKEDWETGCGQMRPKSSSLESTRLAAFGGGRMLNMSANILFLCQGYRMTPLHRGDYGWGHVTENIALEPHSLIPSH